MPTSEAADGTTANADTAVADFPDANSGIGHDGTFTKRPRAAEAPKAEPGATSAETPDTGVNDSVKRE